MKIKLLFLTLLLFCISIVFFAGCAKNKYIVTFYVDGEVYTTVTAVNGKFTLPDDPLRDGFTFSGWFTDESYSVMWKNENCQTQSDLNLYGFQTKNSINTLKAEFYDGNQLLDVQNIVYGEKISEPDKPVKDGYNFAGWFADGVLFNLDSAVERDLVLFAKFEAVTYTVKFIDGETVIGEESYTAEDKNITVPVPPQKEYYDSCWEDFSLTLGNMEVKVIYTPIIYTVTFDCGNGNVYARQYSVENQVITPPPVPLRTGYTGSWNEYELNFCDITVNASYTLILYKATFIADGETVKVGYFTIEDMTVTEPAIPQKNGFSAKWERYVLKPEDITIKAEYTRIH